jgi:hypothetical protein
MFVCCILHIGVREKSMCVMTHVKVDFYSGLDVVTKLNHSYYILSSSSTAAAATTTTTHAGVGVFSHCFYLLVNSFKTTFGIYSVRM